MGSPVDVLTLQRGCFGVREVQYSHFQAVGVSIDAQVGHRDATGGGEGIKTWNDELTEPGCRVEAGSEAGEDSGVKGVVEGQVLPEPSNELRSVGLPFLPPG